MFLVVSGAISARHDPLGERFGPKQKEILRNVSNSQLWLSVGHGGGQGKSTCELREHSSTWFPRACSADCSP